MSYAVLQAAAGCGAFTPPVASPLAPGEGVSLVGHTSSFVPPYVPPATTEGSGAGSWWDRLSTIGKVAVVGGGVAAVALAAVLARKKFRANARARLPHRPRSRPSRAPRRADPVGHARAPLKYRRLGAVRASQYAWPEFYMYPIHDARHVRAAAARFAKWKQRYSRSERRLIARRIDQAKRRFGIGEYRRAR